MADFKHVDFWVAAAGIASAVLIANALVVTQMLRTKYGRWSSVGYILSALAVLASFTTMLAALQSLEDGRDRGVRGTQGALVAIAVEVLCTFFGAICAGFADDEFAEV